MLIGTTLPRLHSAKAEAADRASAEYPTHLHSLTLSTTSGEASPLHVRSLLTRSLTRSLTHSLVCSLTLALTRALCFQGMVGGSEMESVDMMIVEERTDRRGQLALWSRGKSEDI